MTHKSLFKEAAQRIVQLGQMSDAPTQTAGQLTGTGASIDGSNQARGMAYPAGGSARQQPVLDTHRRDR